MPDKNKPSVPFTNNNQTLLHWCWAAIAANVYNSLRGLAPGHEGFKRPCDVAGLVLPPVPVDPATSPPTTIDPCSNEGIEKYDAERGLATALDALHIRPKPLTTASPPDTVRARNRAKNPDLLATELKKKYPVCAEINWDAGGAHIVAISAVNNDVSHIWVEDPMLGPGDILEYEYRDFRSNYEFQGNLESFQLVVKPNGGSSGRNP